MWGGWGQSMWSHGLGNLPELGLGPQVGWNVPVPSPTHLPSLLKLPSPEGWTPGAQ